MSPTVLIVEPDLSFARCLADILNHIGEKAIVSDEPEEATLLAKTIEPKVVFVAHTYVRQNPELLSALRPLVPHLVLLGADYLSLSFVETRALGADAALCRPMAYFEVQECLEQLLQRQPSSASSHRVTTPLSPQGKLVDLTFDVLLYRLFDTRFTGRLSLRQGQNERNLFFLKGFPCAATTNTHSESFSAMLIRRGLITAEELLALTDDKHDPSAEDRLGPRLVRAKLLTQVQLDELQDTQTRERFLATFEMHDAHWELCPGDAFIDEVTLRVQNPISLILLGISRYEEVNTLADRVQQRQAHFVVPTHNFARLLPYVPLGKNRRELLSAVDGTKRVGDLLRLWNGDLQVFFRFIWSIHAARLIFLSPTPMANRPLNFDHLLEPTKSIDCFMTVGRGIRPPTEDRFTRMPSAVQSGPLLHLLEVHDQLETLNPFTLFGLTPQATSIEIRTALDGVVRLFDAKALRDFPPAEASKIGQVAQRMRAAAEILIDPKRREEARRRYAPELDSDDLSQAQSLLAEGQVDQAVDLLSRYAKRNPTNARACALLARALHLQSAPHESGRLAHAQALLRRAMVLDDNYGEPHFFMAAILQDYQQPTEAMRHLRRGLHLDPNHPLAEALKKALLPPLK